MPHFSLRGVWVFAKLPKHRGFGQGHFVAVASGGHAKVSFFNCMKALDPDQSIQKVQNVSWRPKLINGVLNVAMDLSLRIFSRSVFCAGTMTVTKVNWKLCRGKMLPVNAKEIFGRAKAAKVKCCWVTGGSSRIAPALCCYPWRPKLSDLHWWPPSWPQSTGCKRLLYISQVQSN